jgi:hypothetical protein
MRLIVSKHTARKWWYRWIRTLSWFSFRYYWFVWLLFILSTLLLLWLIQGSNKVKRCDTRVIEKSIEQINENLNYCCDCVDQVVTDDPVAPPSPADVINCDDQNRIKDEGSNVAPAPKSFEVGNVSGTIKLCYNNGDIFPDNIKVLHNGNVIFETGVVTGKNCVDVPYVYNPGDPTYVQVIVEPSNSQDTKWEYQLGCPQ